MKLRLFLENLLVDGATVVAYVVDNGLSLVESSLAFIVRIVQTKILPQIKEFWSDPFNIMLTIWFIVAILAMSRI